MELGKTISRLAQSMERSVSHNDADYTENGLLICGICHQPKQMMIELLGMPRKVSCSCECDKQAWEDERERIRKQTADAEREEKRDKWLPKKMHEWTFANADPSREINICKKYVENWDFALENGTGLILYQPGNVGNGKTYAAAAIANYLIDRDVPVKFTSLYELLHYSGEYNGVFKEIERFDRYPLLIIDDFGVERNSQYASEIIYTVIEGRMRCGKPLIITTNVMPAGESIDEKRILSRIQQCCAQVTFPDEDKRRIKKDGLNEMKRRLRE